MTNQLQWTLSLVLIATGHQLAAASFDCAKARSPLEKGICANPVLSKADEDLNVAWKSTVKTFPVPEFLRTSQRFWLKQTAWCAKEEPDVCVNAFRDRTAFLRKLADAKVYTNYGKQFSVESATIVLFDGDSSIWLYGNCMPDMNHPEPPPDGFLLDEVSRLVKKGKKSLIEDRDYEVEVTADRVLFGTDGNGLMVHPRQPQLDGPYQRVR